MGHFRRAQRCGAVASPPPSGSSSPAAAHGPLRPACHGDGMTTTGLLRRQPPGLEPTSGAPTGSDVPGRSARRTVAVLVVALTAALGAAAVRLVLPPMGLTAVALGTVLVLAVPTSRFLSRRILLTGALLFGATPLLWWADLPLGRLGRAGLIGSLLVGGLAAWLVSGGRRDVRRRARAMLPTVRPVDAIPLLASLATAWVVSGWLRVRSGSAALGALLPGWDNSAHLDMVQMLLRNGVTVDRLAAPAGTVWQFSDYPQGYHAVVATLLQVGGTRATDDPAAVLVAYLHAEAWMLVLLGGLLAAAVCSLPSLRRRPMLALPAATLLVAGFVTGPGGSAFVGGFPNFVYAAALAACVPLLVAGMPRVAMPLQVAALGGLVVGVANAWILLLAVALPAAAVLAVPVTRARWRASRRRWTATGLVLVVVAVGTLGPLHVISGLSAGSVLTIRGGIDAPEPGFIVAVALGAVALCLWTSASARGRGLAWHGITPVVGLLAALAVGAWQLHSAGALSYYFYKLLLGVGLVSLAVIAVGLSGLSAGALTLPGRGPERSTRRFVLHVLAGVVAAVAAAQLTGLTIDGHRQFTAPAQAPEPMGSILTAAAHPLESSQPTLLLPVTAASRLNAQQWYLAVTGRWTKQANETASRVLLTPGADSAVVGALLDEAPDAVVLVDPAQLSTAQQAAGTTARGQRIVGW